MSATCRPERPLVLSSPRPGERKTAWLTRALTEAIRNGVLAPGDRLPPSRTLAAQQNVSRGVVVAAYERLWADGLIAGRSSAGTVVLALTAEPAQPQRRHKVRSLIAPPRDLVEEIYEASLTPERWSEVLRDMARRVNCIGGFISEVGTARRRLEPVQVHGMDDSTSRIYAEHHWQTDIFTPVGAALPPGLLQIGDRLVPRTEIARSEFYNDFLRPNGIGNYIGTILTNDGNGHVVVATLYRPADRESFGDHEPREFQPLIPHLQRAVQIQSTINHAHALEAGLASALDQLHVGVALLDADGRPVFLNRVADAALVRKDGLQLQLNRLRTCDPATDLRFQRAVQLASAATQAAASALVLPRLGPRIVWRALVIPLPQARMPLVANGRCLVWLIPGIARIGGRMRSVCRLDQIDLDLLAHLRDRTTSPPAIGDDELAHRLRRLADATGCNDASEIARIWHVASP